MIPRGRGNRPLQSVVHAVRTGRLLTLLRSLQGRGGGEIFGHFTQEDATMCRMNRWIIAKSTALLILGSGLGLLSARADITGFQGGGDWSANGAGSVPYFSTCPTDMVTLTDDVNNEAASIFCFDQQDVSAFTAQFTYQMSGGIDAATGQFNPADGVAFVIQNDPRGPLAVDGSGGCLAWCGISPSFAVALNVYAGRDGIIGSNVFMNGNLTFYNNNGQQFPVYMDSTPVKLQSGDPIQVSLSYDGTTLTEALLDTTTNDTITFTYTIDAVDSLGNNLAYVGFTAGTGGEHAFQTVSGFSYTQGPPPPP